MSFHEQRALGRAKNAVLEYLHKRLAVPKIFLDRTWGQQAVAVLAIDRDGVGDVHAVQMVSGPFFRPDGIPNIVEQKEEVSRTLQSLHSVPAHYKYIALVSTEADRIPRRFALSQPIEEATFSPDGLGRVGFFTVALSDDGEAEVQLVLKPERFRAFIAQQADEFIRTTPADWEIRPDPVIEEFHA